MKERWYIELMRDLKRLLCFHDWLCSEGPGQPSMHWVCRKCDCDKNDWKATADYYHNLSALWYQRFLEAREALGEFDPERADNLVPQPLPTRKEQRK